MPNLPEIRQLAAQVRAYQLERGWSDSKLCKEVASVGSTKTYKRILDAADALEDLNVDNQLRNYRSALVTIESRRKQDLPPEPEYDDFTNVTESEAAVRRACQEDEECVARLVLVTGATATGKDVVKRHLQRQFPLNCVCVEATDLWKTSPTPGHLALYNALSVIKRGDAKTPRVPSELLAGIVSHLKERKLILIINEGHHMGLPGLNMIKSIINMTPTVVVLICIPSLLTRLLGNNYEEAIQLTGNRLAERVALPTPPAEEIMLLMDRRGVKFVDDAVRNNAGALLANDSPMYGNWRLVNQVARDLFAYSRTGVVSQKVLSDAIAKWRGKRTQILRQPES